MKSTTYRPRAACQWVICVAEFDTSRHQVPRLRADRWRTDSVDLGGRVPHGTAVPAGMLRLSELVGALGHALDITEAQPKGHCIVVCWIGMHIGRKIGLGEREL